MTAARGQLSISATYAEVACLRKWNVWCRATCADERVPPERTLALAACFAAPAFHAHAGGHAIPSDAAFRTALRDFVADAHGASGGACDASDAGRDAPPAGGWAAEVGARCESSYLSWRAVRGAPEPS